ncbi:MAG: TraX family protein [Lachnospirales bacterium]
MPSRTLKIIALLTMALDHIGALYEIEALRVIGRIAFPLFAFMIAEGMYFSRNKLNYIKKLFIFAIISEPFFNLFFNKISFISNEGFMNFVNVDHQNVFFTLGFGALMCYISTLNIDSIKKAIYFILICIVATIIKQDYFLIGSVYIYFLFIFRNKYGYVAITTFVFTVCVYIGLPIYYLIGTLSSLIFIKLYNGEKGSFKNIKYNVIFQNFTYIFYPLHLLLLSIL